MRARRLAARFSGPWLVAALLLGSLVLPLAGDTASGLTNMPTRFYRLHTDLPGAEAQDIAAFLDQMFLSYARIFHYDVRREAPLDVYVFKTREEYFLYYGEDKGLGLAIVQTHGLFIRDLYELAAWGSGQEVREILAHEGTHQFIAMVTTRGQQPPLWFHEGLATYCETARWQNGTISLGAINFGRLADLLAMRVQGRFVPVVPLAELLTADRFSPAHYGEAWSFVYFLLQAYGGRNADVLNRYFILIQQGEDPVKAFAAAFQAPLDTVEGAWRDYVDDLLKKDIRQLLALPGGSGGQSRR